MAPSLVERLETAVRMEGKGELEQALNCYRSVVDLDPNDLEALSLLGKLEHRLGDHKAAIFHLKRASRLAPTRPDIHLGLGHALSETGKKRQAAKSYLDAVDADARFAPAYIGLGRIFAENHQLAQAEQAYTIALEMGSTYPEVNYQLGKIYFANGNLQGALDALLKAQQLGGEYPDLNIICARICLQLDNDERAKEFAQSHIDVYPQDSSAWTLLAIALGNLQRFTDAMQACQLALQFDARNSMALAQIGSLHFQRGDLKGARRSFEVALKMDGMNQSALLGLAQLEEQNGKNEAALRYLRRLGDPKDYTLQAALLCSRVSAARGLFGSAIRLLKYRLANRLDSRQGKRAVHMELAQLHHQDEQYVAAFKHFQNANELTARPDKSVSPQFSSNQIKQYFSKSTFSRLPRSSCQKDGPIFVIGALGLIGKIVHKLFGSSDRFQISTEHCSLADIAKRLPHELASPEQFPQVLDQVRSAELKHLSSIYLQSNEYDGQNKNHYVDCHPDNIQYLGLALLLFPNCKVIRFNQLSRQRMLDLYSGNFCDAKNFFTHSFGGLRNYLEIENDWIIHWTQTLELPLFEFDLTDVVEQPRSVLNIILPAEFSHLEQSETSIKQTEKVLSEASRDWRSQINQLDAFYAAVDHLMPI